jgi:glycosyltransferase involved in cell wall biosynthesis
MLVAEGGDAGGIGRYCVDLAAAIGPRARVACLCDRPCSAATTCWLAAQCARQHVPLDQVRMPPKAWFAGARGLRGLWRRLGRPMVHVNGRRANAVAIALRLAQPGFRYVMTVHGVLGLHSRRNAVYRLVDYAAGHLAETVIAVSEHGRRMLLRAGTPPGRTVTIPNALAPGALEELRGVAARREGPAEAVRIGFLGRISPEKGSHELVEVARRLVDGRLSGTLDIVGDGPDQAWLEAELRTLATADLVQSRGRVDEITGVLRDVDVLLMPSRNEGLPYVLLEGMAAGCAVVAYAVGGIPEVVDDPAVGSLVPPGDLEAFVAALQRLIADPDLVAAMGSAASAHVAESFSLSARLPQIWRAYGRRAPADRQ